MRLIHTTFMTFVHHTMAETN